MLPQLKQIIQMNFLEYIFNGTQNYAYHVITININTNIFTNTEMEPLPIPSVCKNVIFDNDTGETLKYFHLIKREKYCKKIKSSFINLIELIYQGLGGRIKEKTHSTSFFSTNYWRRSNHIYGQIFVNWKPKQVESTKTIITTGGNLWLTLTISKWPPLTWPLQKT